MAEDRQRIDKWLWHARVVRTRSAAAVLAASGHVRVNGQRIDAASRGVRVGDVLTVALDHSVRVIKVAGFAQRRGGPDAARALYENLAPDGASGPGALPRPGGLPGPGPPLGSVPGRDRGTGRPTKRERRELDRLRDSREDK
jgi:ribosome-associated heat shock protein Hsp15